MIRRIARGLALFDDPLPGPGVTGTLSDGTVRLGSLPLVSSLGMPRYATYRSVYLSNPWVYGAVSMIARAIGRLPAHVFALDEEAQKQRQRGDVPQTPGRLSAGASLDRLLSRPSNRMSRYAMFAGTVVDRLVLGNALWEIEKSGGVVTGLNRVSWRTVAKVDTNSDGSVNFYELQRRKGETRPRQLMPTDVVHFGLGSDPEGPVAVSPLQACHATIALHEAVIRHLLAYFENSARLSGHLALERLTKDNAAEMRELITELYTSPENAGKVLITGAGKWESMQDSPDHSAVVELIDKSREEIAAAYAVPPPVLGILDRAIKSNVKELREQFGRETVGPMAAEFEQELAAQLLTQQPAWRSLFVEFQLAEQLRPDLEARAMVYQRLMPFFTIDEIRGFENASPLKIPGKSDVPWVPSGAMPISQAGGVSPRTSRAASSLADVSENGHHDHEPALVTP